MGHPITHRAAAAATATLVLTAGAGCRMAAEPEALGEPLAAGGADLSSVDFDNAVYASACGLSWVDVGSGVGEGPSVGGTYGLEVVDSVVADLDGAPGVEAAVLVDCLGGDTFSPQVLGFSADSVGSTDGGPPLLQPTTGASLPAGHRPLALEAAGDGTVIVELQGLEGRFGHELSWSEHVMRGGELTPVAGSEVHGVVVATEGDDVLVVSLAPGVAYRLATVEGLTAVDPDSGATMGPEGLGGRTARLTLGAQAEVTAVDLLPSGAA